MLQRYKNYLTFARKEAENFFISFQSRAHGIGWYYASSRITFSTTSMHKVIKIAQIKQIAKVVSTFIIVLFRG